MYRLETTKPLYDEIKELLPDICPNVPIRLASEDQNLVKLGFAKEVPCVIELDVSDEEFEDMMIELLDIETDAFNTEDGKNPPPNDPYYLRYLKYGWISDVLTNAKKVK